MHDMNLFIYLLIVLYSYRNQDYDHFFTIDSSLDSQIVGLFSVFVNRFTSIERETLKRQVN